MERNAHPYQIRGQKWQVRFLHAGIGCMLRHHSFHYACRSLRYRGAAFRENDMDIKYKGISKDKITEIQKINMPRFEIPIIDIDIMRENDFIINNYVDEIAKREERNGEIYIVCEMAKLYLETIRKKEKKCCETCNWYIDFAGVCTNDLSENCANFRDDDYVCECWERK